MEGLENGDSGRQQQLDPSDPHLDSFEATASHDDFLEQMLSTLPNCSWPDLSANPNPNNAAKSNKSPWDNHDLKSQDESGQDPQPDSDHPSSFPSFEDLSSKLRLHQVNNGNAAKALLLQQQQLLLSRGDAGLMPFPLTLASAGGDMMQPDTSSFKSTSPGADGPVQPLYNGFPGPLHGSGQPTTHPFQAGGKPAQSFGGPGAGVNGAPASASTGGSGQAPQRQRVRARRGQATDPHSIAERLRRERIAERMKALQELVPNGNKTDKASMLDEIIDYVKFLQLQVKVLSMSRLGGAGAMAPRVADLSSEGGSGGGIGRSSNAAQAGGASSDTMTVTEHQVAKLMEEDMGSAMQYLQGKGLCLMPISLATAISTATCHTRSNGNLHSRHHPANGPVPPANGNGNMGDRPTSPNLSGLTVQSANLVNGDGSAKDSNATPNA